VEAAGLCHSDLHLMDWPAGTVPYTLPFTLGHETAGTVAAVGPGARGAAEGDRVLVYARWGCGACSPCLQGMENLCEIPAGDLGGHGGGVGRDGGLAEYMVVPSARYLVPIPDLDPVAAAPLADAALTAYHAIKRWLPALRPGATAVVIGIGGLGHMAVQLLRALSNARVMALDVRESARRLALEAGAHAAVAGAGELWSPWAAPSRTWAGEADRSRSLPRRCPSGARCTFPPGGRFPSWPRWWRSPGRGLSEPRPSA
jgi:propanol-preferring alcohol dehydrogenase